MCLQDPAPQVVDHPAPVTTSTAPNAVYAIAIVHQPQLDGPPGRFAPPQERARRPLVVRRLPSVATTVLFVVASRPLAGGRRRVPPAVTIVFATQSVVAVVVANVVFAESRSAAVVVVATRSSVSSGHSDVVAPTRAAAHAGLVKHTHSRGGHCCCCCYCLFCYTNEVCPESGNRGVAPRAATP